MNKTLGIAIGVAMVVMPFIASAATFTTNLTVGSTGADVTALQTVLNSAGYLAVNPTGYFGNLTKAALAKWQAANGISPAVGYFGPITRAAMSGGVVTTPAAGCPAGFTCTPTAGGTPVVGTTWAPDGTDGSITLSYVSYAPASQTLKKGDMNKPLISVKLQAVNGKVAVSRFDVHFSERPWLDFGSLSLTDSTGKILATKTLSSSADSTEITVGSDYLVRFDQISPIVVTPGSDVIVAVTANVLAASDKITGQIVYVAVPTGSVRTINGKGYTDSVGIGATSQGGAPNITYGNAATLSTTGSTADIYTRVSPSSPTQRIVVTSASQTTSNVTLGVFSLKSANQNSTLNSLSFNIKNSTGAATTTLISNLRLSVGGQTYGANALTAGNTTFTNMSVPLTVDQWTDATLTADINAAQTNISASSTLVAASIVGVDSNYNTVTKSNASNVTSSDTTFLTAGVAISATSASFSPSNGTNGITHGGGVTFTFTVTNTGNNDVYISKVPSIALATSTTGSSGSPVAASSTITYVTASPTTLSSDGGTAPSSGEFVVQSGNSRTFTYTGAVDNTNGTTGVRVFKITNIYFATTTGNVSSSTINFGLDNLVVTPVLQQ